MKAGITYDLREAYLREGFGEEETAEFDKPDTIEAIEEALGQLGYVPERIGHARALVQKLAGGARWDIVFNIAEGMYGMGREALVPALLDAYRIPYTFSDAVVLGLSLHKAHTKRLLRDAGLPTPDFAVVSDAEQSEKVNLPFPLFAKPLGEGSGKGISQASCIRSREELRRVCRMLLSRFGQPVLVERFLPGREFTVGVLGTGGRAETLGVMEVVLRPEAEEAVYSYANKACYEKLVEYRLVTEAAIGAEARELSLAAWRVLEGRDAGRIDLRADERGRLNILELNPLAGINPIHSDLPILAGKVGMGYLELIERIMGSALGRAGLEPPCRAEVRGVS